MPVRAVLFDLDNTLLMEDEMTRHALRRASERAGASGQTVAAAAEQAADDLFRASPSFDYAERMGIWWGEALWGDFSGDAEGLRAVRDFVPGFRQAVWTTALAAAGIDDPALAGELATLFAQVRRADWGIDPAAVPTLDALGSRYRLALVTNGAPAVQREKLSGSGIGSRFETTVISGELGIGKPDPRIFEVALDALGVTAAGAVMVGDSVERDIEGARAAGLGTIWIDRDGTGSEPADLRIGSLAELPAAVDAMRDLVPSARSA
jgi:putative hydrolase of the HAD superfamily